MFLERLRTAFRPLVASAFRALWAMEWAYNRHIAFPVERLARRVHERWLEYVEGPYLALHAKSLSFRIGVQAGALLAIVPAVALGLYGLMCGVAGVGGITLALLGAESPFGLGISFALFAAGVALVSAAVGLGWLVVTFMNRTVKRSLLGGTMAFMGFYMAWFGLGVLGVWTALGLDPFGVFQYAYAGGVDAVIMFAIAFVGTALGALGVITLPVPAFKQVYDALRA